MRMPETIPPTMLAPCGITCEFCYVHLRQKKPCRGCRALDNSQPEHCRKCQIKDCALGQGLEFCFQCPTYPCKVIKRLDKSYRQRYNLSLISNALRLKSVGTVQFLEEERAKWTCAECSGAVSLHDGTCSECGKEHQTHDAA